MEAPLVARELDNEDQALKHLLDTFGSVFSLEEIASTYCKADRDVDLAGEVLCGMRTSRPSADATIEYEELIDGKTSSTAIDDNGYDESHHADKDGSKASNLKRNSASAGTISSVGKKYIWRIAGSDKTLNETKPLKVEAASMASNSSVREKNCVWRIAGSNETPNGTEPLKVEAASMASNSSVNGKNSVWRIAGSKETTKGTKPFKMEANAFSVPVKTSEESLLSKDSDSCTSERSSCASNASSNDDVEDFLFEMFGRGFHLDRSAIREVLGNCGHDMKKSLETLLDLTAVTIDRRSNLCEGSNPLPDFESNSSAKQVHKQKSAQSNGIRTGLIPSRHSSEAYEQKKDVITALIHTPERPDLTVMSASAPVHEPDMRSGSTQTMVTEPLNAIADDYKVKTTIPQFDNIKVDVGNFFAAYGCTHIFDIHERSQCFVGHRVMIQWSMLHGTAKSALQAPSSYDAKEGSYHFLRKAVKEHRETMKEYYRAAAEASARGDRGRAVLLLEKGQFFHNKAREADEESATKIFETSDSSIDGKMQDEMLLDLQDHDAKEAIRLIKLHLRTLSGIPLVSDLKLIIGNGDRDAEKRKRLIVKLLQKEAINWTEDEDSGAILIHLDKINPKSLSFGSK